LDKDIHKKVWDELKTLREMITRPYEETIWYKIEQIEKNKKVK